MFLRKWLLAIFLFISSSLLANCEYIAPSQSGDEMFFPVLIFQAHEKEQTFETILASLEENKSTLHQFTFKYPLENAEHAAIFAKALQIKAQEAHRFVPVIKECQFVEPSHLGFTRQIKIDGDGPTIQEHVLVEGDSVIFIEEWVSTQNGVQLGCFTALNRVIEESGVWYFEGIYLYADQPNQEKIEERIATCVKTYENMVDFIENGDVEAVYDHLKSFN